MSIDRLMIPMLSRCSSFRIELLVSTMMMMMQSLSMMSLFPLSMIYQALNRIFCLCMIPTFWALLYLCLDLFCKKNLEKLLTNFLNFFKIKTRVVFGFIEFEVKMSENNKFASFFRRILSLKTLF